MPTASHDPALAELLAHGPWLRRLAQQLVAGPGVDDLVQETWVDALQHPPRTDRPLRPWLAAVLRNRSRMRRRAQQRRIQREQGQAERPPPAALPDALLTRVELLRRVEQLVAELDEPFRSTVLRHYFEDRSAADIARDSGIPAATVRSRLKTGLDRIRGQLDRQSGGDRSAWCMALAPLYTSTPPKAGLAALTTTAMKISSTATIATVVGAATLGVWGFIASRGDAPAPTEARSSTNAASEVTSAASAPDRRSILPKSRESYIPTATVVRFGSEQERERLLEHLRIARARRLTAEAEAAARLGSERQASQPVAEEQFQLALVAEIQDNYLPLAQECAEQVPGGARGDYRFEYRIVAEPNVGGLIEDAEVEPQEDANSTPDLLECLIESLYTLELPASEEPLSQEITLQIGLDGRADEQGGGDSSGG